MKNKILILDIETTGFFNKGGKIVEIGIVSLDITTGEKEILFDEVVHERPISKEEVQNSWIVTNGFMTVEEIQHSNKLEDRKDDIQKIINNYPSGCTAYNNKFDFEFMEDRGFVFPKKLPCPMLIATHVCEIPGAYGHYKWPKVEEAYKFFFPLEEYEEKHRGADDAFHEADIVYSLIQMGKFKVEIDEL